MTGSRIVVLGAAGMLGHKVFQRLREEFPDTRGLVRNDPRLPPLSGVEMLQGPDVIHGVDVGDFDGLEARLRTLAPDVIVNCVGLIKQRDHATDPIRSITINALLPHRLAAVANEWGGRLIHFSTDCVFSGRRGMYTEEDGSDAEDLYGRTKSLGEVRAANAITVRSSIIGRELSTHRSLLDWFLSANRSKVRGFRRAIYSGVTTNEMARIVAHLIRTCGSLAGLFQVASIPITKYDLLVLIRKEFGLEIEIEPDDKEVSDRSLAGEKFERVTGRTVPPWETMIRDLAGDPTPYGRWGVSVL